MQSLTTNLDYPFLAGGGEMGDLIRAKDWSRTPLGTPDTWPQSLRTLLALLLNSRFPMFLFWGPELLCFYNDAYRPSLGKEGRHPVILGMPGAEAWPDIWPVIKPLIDQVLLDGRATWQEDLLLPIYRNGRLEEVYWTFSYSPVVGESNVVNGVFVTCHETTQQVNLLKKVEKSEQDLKTMIEQTPVAMCIFRGPNHVLELANDRLIELSGAPREQIQGRPIFQALPEARGQGLELVLDGVYHSGTTFLAKERQVILPRGGRPEVTYLNFQCDAIRRIDGSISGILATVVEVTEQVVARKKMEDLEERARMAIDAAKLGTFDKDLQTGEANFSNRFYEIFGYDVNKVSSEELEAAIHPEDLPMRELANEQALETGSVDYEVRIRQPNKSLRWVHTQGKIMFDAIGQPLRYLGIIKDITAQKTFAQHLEESVRERTKELVQANDALEKMNRELASFAYITSHDLQEPLRKIQAFATLILQKEQQGLSENGRNYFQRMQDAANRMQQLIDDLLAYSRANNSEKVFKETNLNDLVREVLEVLEDRITEKKARIDVADLPTLSVIDFQMRQVFMNLLSNSLKFVRPGVSPHIVIGYAVTEGQSIHPAVENAQQRFHHFSVRDNGIGFAPEYAQRIFEVFKRLHGRNEYQGTGIGLAICKKIVENHRGLISAEGRPDEGATFHILLPVE